MGTGGNNKHQQTFLSHGVLIIINGRLQLLKTRTST